nr:MAG TPA: hypothetical protein [Caudoviricetes sp.]
MPVYCRGKQIILLSSSYISLNLLKTLYLQAFGDFCSFPNFL